MERIIFWGVMFFVILLTPFAMMWMGWYFQTRSVHKMGTGSGYRTFRSMKNKDTWVFAHLYSGKLYDRIGQFSLIPSMIPMFFVFGKDINTIGMMTLLIVCIQQVLMIYPFFPTERALKRTFDKYGNRLE